MHFNQSFDDHSRWRQSFSSELQRLSNWLRDNDLQDAAVADEVEGLRQRVASDKVMVAFVAEFSRGKSELINALFFAGYGRRIMPASAGRTTMCPTELGYDPELPPCLKLLPIETRLKAQSMVQWRTQLDDWESAELDVSDAEGLAAAMSRVAEVTRVTPEIATRLGFWHEQGGADSFLIGDDGCVEVPKWRHALINIAHPLLKQGLTILDTPGLNAIGAEPELTVSLLPQAHAVVFILGADTGVTQSDLRIWQEHLASSVGRAEGSVVVLNKIDTLWDALSSNESAAQQIDRQCVSTAKILGVDRSRVLAVSAQKALVAKIQGDDALLSASCLPALEDALVNGIIGQRRRLLKDAVSAKAQGLLDQVNRLIQYRLRDLTEQSQELDSLRGKNGSVIKHMRLRIEQEQQEFEQSGGRIQAVRSVHLKLLGGLYETLGHAQVTEAAAQLIQRLKEPGLKLGVRKTYAQTFDGLRQLLEQAERYAHDIQTMLTNSFGQLNTEFGMTLHVDPPPPLDGFQSQLSEVEQDHLQYLSVGHTIKLAQHDFCERLGRALLGRIRDIFELAATELQAWNKAAARQLDGQLRDRRKNFARRVEAVTRIEEAAGGLDERMQELAVQTEEYEKLQAQLLASVQSMLQGDSAVMPPSTPSDALVSA